MLRKTGPAYSVVCRQAELSFRCRRYAPLSELPGPAAYALTRPAKAGFAITLRYEATLRIRISAHFGSCEHKKPQVSSHVHPSGRQTCHNSGQSRAGTTAPFVANRPGSGQPKPRRVVGARQSQVDCRDRADAGDRLVGSLSL
jgi:hypothetical protein